jgi:c-di-GMP phosphodiesterase
MQDQTFIGRQPIVDLEKQIIGYELFFRHSADAKTAVFEDDFMACVNVLVSTIGQMDVKWLLDDKPAFINVDEKMLMSNFLELMSPHHTVLEILRSVQHNDAIVERCQQLKKLGYRIALDNPHLNGAAHFLLQYADFVKIDIQKVSLTELETLFSSINGPSLIVEKVETEEQFEACKNIGFSMFQGYYFSRPETLTANVINASFGSVVNILSLISQGADNKAIETGFKRDAVLLFKLLRYINSVNYGLSCEVQSINHALTILGRNQLYHWLNLLKVTAGEHATPQLMMKVSIARGRLIELLGESYFEEKDLDNLFMVGVFSFLDAILKMPIDQVLDRVQLPETVTDALLNREGLYGPFLLLAEACEDADNKQILELSELLQMDSAKVNECRKSALAWAEALVV